MKACPKCQQTHNKPGVFCSRSCANSRGPRTEEFKRAVSLKLKNKKPPTKKKKISEITGKVLYADHWSHPSRASFLKQVAGWFGIELQTPNTANDFNQIREQIKEAYDSGLSSLGVKDRFKIPLPNGHMPAFLKQMGIPRRTQSEAQRNAILHGRAITIGNAGYKQGWHADFEGKVHYYRSSYELDLYKELDKKQIPYKTESIRVVYFDTTSQQQRIAIPDILILEKVVLEVKSSYRVNLERQNIIDKFKSYRELGYRPLLVVDGKIWWRITDSNCSPGV